MTGTKLLTADNVADFFDDGVLRIQQGQILTPGAKDMAKKKGVVISYGALRKPDQLKESSNTEDASDSDTHSSNSSLISGNEDHFPTRDDPGCVNKSIIMPPVNYFGYGSLQKAVDKAKFMGFQRGLIVTDATLNKVGIVAKVYDKLAASNIEGVVFDGVQPNPTVMNVKNGLSILRRQQCDFVISLGGGSPHDCAKAIALLSTNGGNIEDYEGVDKVKKAAMPMIAINTTAGTASEMTRFCIITNEKTKTKMAIIDAHVTPVVSVNDSELMLAMPTGLTAATGMDALTHAIEAYLSNNVNPMTDAVAGKAIEMIAEYLPRAVAHGNDIEAREQMACAQFMAGVAFNNAGLGYVHAMAHQLGGVYGLPHGICNAVLLPHVMAFVLRSREQRLAEIARNLNCDTQGMTHREAAVEGIKRICQLLLDVNIPTSLLELGVQQEDIPAMAANALKDPCALNSPCYATQEEIEGIYQDAFGF